MGGFSCVIHSLCGIRRAIRAGPGAGDQISNLGIFAAELGATEENVQEFCDDAIPGPIAPIDLGSIAVR